MAANVMLQPASPLQIAKLIRRLDSRLMEIVGEMRDNKLTLTYTFRVAGSFHVFSSEITGPTVASIADLYPHAAAFEERLARQWGLVFQQSDDLCMQND